MHKHKHWLHAVAITFPQKMEHVRDDWTRLSLGNHSWRNAHDIDRRVEYHATGCYQFDASPLRKGDWMEQYKPLSLERKNNSKKQHKKHIIW